MKKRFFCLSLVLLFFSYSVFCISNKDNISIEVFTTVDNISSSEQSWLGAVVEERLEANLSKYTEFKIVNKVNKKQIFDLQKASEGAAFDEESMLEAGNYTTANHGIFLTVRKAGLYYTISIRFTNLNTGETIATVLSESKKNVEDLYAYNGCAVDHMTIELCDQLGVNLTPTQKHFILNGETGLSSEEKNKQYQADVEFYSNQIKSIENEMDSLTLAATEESKYMQNQLEADKTLAEEKLKLARENQRRAYEEEQKRMADERKNSERTIAQRDRINSMSQELNEKINHVMNVKMDQESILGQIKVIELKKKSLVEIYQKINFEKQKILDEANNEVQKRSNEIKNRKPRAVETDGMGNLTENALNHRRDEIEEETKSILKKAQENIKGIKDKIESQNKALLNEIYSDYEKLTDKKVNTLGTDLVVDYGNYNGDQNGWPIDITVKSDGVIIFQTKSFLPYEELTGHKVVSNYKDKNFESYADEVDLYNSLFLRGEPIVTYELEYSVKPMSLNHPSEYKFYFTTLKYYDSRHLSVRGNTLKSSRSGIIFMEDNTTVKKMLPAYDLRSFEEVAELDYELTEADISGNNYDNYDDYDYDDENDSNISPVPEKKDESNSENNSRNKGRSLMVFNYGFMGLNMPGSAVQFDFTSALNNYVFFGFNLDILIPDMSPGKIHPLKKDMYPVTKKSNIVMNTGLCVGANYKFNLGFFKPNIYGTAGAGINFFGGKNSNLKQNIIDCVIALEVGVDFGIGNALAVTTGYGIDFVIGKGMYDKINIGLAMGFGD